MQKMPFVYNWLYIYDKIFIYIYLSLSNIILILKYIYVYLGRRLCVCVSFVLATAWVMRCHAVRCFKTFFCRRLVFAGARAAFHVPSTCITFTAFEAQQRKKLNRRKYERQYERPRKYIRSWHGSNRKN